MTAGRYPKRIESVHVESIDGDLCVYDTARQRCPCVEPHGGVRLATV